MKCFLLSVLLAALVCSCQNQKWNKIHPTPSAEYMVLDEIKYVEEFPYSYTLQEGDEVADFNVIGIRDFLICDSLLIFSTVDKEGLWSCYSLRNNKFLGKFLKQGNGPNEFFMTPFVSQASIMYDENNNLNAIIYESMQQKVLKINISETLEKQELVIDELDIETPYPTFVFLMLNDSSFYVRTLSHDETKQERSIIEGGNKLKLHNLELLNKASVQPGDHDFNIISILARYNPEKKIIVEAPIGLNYINLYSTTSNYGKSICAIEKEFDNISTIQKMKSWERLYTYAGITAFKDFFGTLYIGETMKDYQKNDKKKLPKIHLFTWDGEPLVELLLPHQATSFDIDFINGYLYAIDLRSDSFYKYDINKILKDIGDKIAYIAN